MMPVLDDYTPEYGDDEFGPVGEGCFLRRNQQEEGGWDCGR